ncbi:hypothetical protein [Streptomyces sp. NPDC049585]|uniref:hypothetical protein n=1 Tax=Streptomyces sp. NPDC049585 TaxID=3155154 RepID=UPI003440139C
MHFGHGKDSAKGVGSRHSFGSPEAARRAMLAELREVSAGHEGTATARSVGDAEVLERHSGQVYQPRGKGRQEVTVPVRNPDGVVESVTVTVDAPVGSVDGGNGAGQLLVGLGVLFLGAAVLTMTMDWGQVGAVLGALVTGGIGAVCLVYGIRELR